MSHRVDPGGDPGNKRAPASSTLDEAPKESSGEHDTQSLPQLADLASKINAEHAAAEQHARTAVEHAIAAGELLAQAKAQLPHGAWLPWLAENFTGSTRTASAYMRLSANRQRVADLTTVREALEYLSEPRDQPSTAIVEHETTLEDYEHVRQSLVAIRDAKLYRETHATFEAYCQDRWGFPPDLVARYLEEPHEERPDPLAAYDRACAELRRAHQMVIRFTDHGMGGGLAACAQCDRADDAIKAVLSRDEVADALEAGQITADQAIALYAVQASNREPEQQRIEIRLRWERYLGDLLRSGELRS